MKKTKKFNSFIITLLVLSTVLSINIYAQDNEEDGYVSPVRAKVIKIVGNESSDIESSGGTLNIDNQIVKVKILEGEHLGEIVEAEHSLNAYFTENQRFELKVGDKVLVLCEENELNRITNAYVTDLSREGYLTFIIVLFFGLLLFIGRGKGLRAIFSLLFTVLVVIKVLLPLVLKGYNPIIISIVLCSIIIAVAIVIVGGFKTKTIAAIIGTVSGVAVAGVLALIIGNMARLTGLGNEESQMLMYLPNHSGFNFKGLLFAGIIIGAIGAIMDVGMSIASSMYEIKINSIEISFKDLFKSGINVGRDIMGTMSNTLILAYTGGAMNLLLLYMAYEIPFKIIINTDLIASEIIRAIAGSIGIILTIPITALIAAYLYNRYESEEQLNN